MKTPTPFWPRGLLAGALLAAFLIVPALVVIVVDAGAGTARLRPDANGRFTLFQRPIQLRARGDFFAGKLSVQAVLAQRFALLPAKDDNTSADHRGDATVSPSPPPEVARDSMLRLRLVNHSAENLEVGIVRVESMLGNVVARPDRLMLAPNQTADIDSLVPEQKISTGSLPVALALRLSGQVESRQLVLKERTVAQAGD